MTELPKIVVVALIFIRQDDKVLLVRQNYGNTSLLIDYLSTFESICASGSRIFEAITLALWFGRNSRSLCGPGVLARL